MVPFGLLSTPSQHILDLKCLNQIAFLHSKKIVSSVTGAWSPMGNQCYLFRSYFDGKSSSKKRFCSQITRQIIILRLANFESGLFFKNTIFHRSTISKKLIPSFFFIVVCRRFRKFFGRLLMGNLTEKIKKVYFVVLFQF